jgi:2-dehydro-3-deoxyphosphogluconate aldolase/(4S)-4-hydroxy-2-oxoglutarate aldolase
MNENAFDLIGGVPVLPVVAFETVEETLPVARALAAGGMTAIEVTLRTDCAIDALAILARQCPELAVGAGTITNKEQLLVAREAGARFAISPGLTPELLHAAKAIGIPYLPGVATASEIMIGLEAGYRAFKFFPAEAAGGVAMLKSWAGPFPGVDFCPTGGVEPANLGAYLTLGNVRAVGMSWMTPKSAIKSGDWREIERRARTVAMVFAERRGGTAIA